MSNMSYCRFRNTIHDLNDCAEALIDDEPLSEEESKAAGQLIKTCRQIVEWADENQQDHGD